MKSFICILFLLVTMMGARASNTESQDLSPGEAERQKILDDLERSIWDTYRRNDEDERKEKKRSLTKVRSRRVLAGNAGEISRETQAKRKNTR